MSQDLWNNIQPYLILIPLVALLYFMMIRPQSKQRKKIQEMMNNMKVGDKVKTIGGFYGKISSIKEDVITLECGPDKVKLVISKQAIATVEDADVENTMSDSEKLS